jgi:predicted glycogen debranching enzyme
MDAKIGEWVVTPRQGKAIEINALWYNALKIMQGFASRFDFPMDKQLEQKYAKLAAQVKTNFERTFWYAEGGYFYDVIDEQDIPDPTLRPNQVIALGVAPELVAKTKARTALAKVKTELLTPYGLRTLNPSHPKYSGHYGGDQFSRDSVYHQGTVWPWPLGPYVRALLYFSTSRKTALTEVLELLKPFQQHLDEAGLNSVSEIFEADPPFKPVGCYAQAWSVAALLEIIEAIS